MLGGELVVVYAIDDGQVDALGRGRDQDAAGAGVDMFLSALSISEEAGAFQRDLDAVRLVRKVGGVALGSDLDALAIDDDRIAFGLHVAGELAVDAVVLEQPRIGLGVGEVVDADKLKPAVGTLEDRAGDQAADAAKSVDGDFGHWIPLVFMKSVMRTATLSGVRPK